MGKDGETGVLLYEIGSSQTPPPAIPDHYKHAKLFVVDGIMQVDIDNEQYTLQRGDLADIIRRTLRLTEMSNEARGYLLLLTDDYMQEIFGKQPPFSLRYVTHVRQRPVTHINPMDYTILIRAMESIQQATNYPPIRFARDILTHNVQIFFLLMAGVVETNHPETIPPEGDTDKRRQLFADFLKMLDNDIRQGHTVEFFAARLNVTTQYLGRVVKEQSGQTAYDIICRYLLQEICSLLRETGLSLQEIADKLHFSDQSVMSKFFKRLKGMSPLKYRNQRQGG